MNLLIVESPNKVKKIESILGPGWVVLASSGHIRDLPSKDLGIDPQSYALQYEFKPRTPIPGSPGKTFPGGKDRVNRIASYIDNASKIYLATDPDREGEAISWHLKTALKLKDGQYARVAFDAITEGVIRAAIGRARSIDTNLVYAQEARRALDRLVGWKVSPALRDAVGTNASAGRVQSPAVRIVVDREREIRAFIETKHFGATVSFDKSAWTADWYTKPHLAGEAQYILDEALAKRAAACRAFKVTTSETSLQREAPPPPFSTSLMLQAASITLKLNPEQTAKLAQKLFEQGTITYHRTDSVNFSAEAIQDLRGLAAKKGWTVPDQPRRFKVKGDAQEAHEAIRPTHLEDEAAGEDDDQRALYRLIWQRAVASQLADAVYSVTALQLAATDSPGFEFRARGRFMKSPGWRVLTAGDAAEDPVAKDDEAADGGKVPALKVESAAIAESGQVVPKKTKPPVRYTQATLIKKLEAAGIGRPSTYPAIMTNIIDRRYLIEQRRFLSPTPIGESLIDVLIAGKFSFIDLAFTRQLEADLDRIAAGKATYRDVVAGADQRLKQELAGQAATPSAPAFPCPLCGKALRRLKGARGAFWGCSGYRDGCKGAMDDEKGKPVQPKPAPTYPCPTCSKPMRRIEGKKGVFWGCSGFRDGCKTTLEDKKGKPVIVA